MMIALGYFMLVIAGAVAFGAVVYLGVEAYWDWQDRQLVESLYARILTESGAIKRGK